MSNLWRSGSVPLTGLYDEVLATAAAAANAMARLRQLADTARATSRRPPHRTENQDARDCDLADALERYYADWLLTRLHRPDYSEKVMQLCDAVERARTSEEQLDIDDIWMIWPYIWRDLQITSARLVAINIGEWALGPCTTCSGNCDCDRSSVHDLVERLPPSQKILFVVNELWTAVELVGLPFERANTHIFLDLGEGTHGGLGRFRPSPWKHLYDNAAVSLVGGYWCPYLSKLVATRGDAVESLMYARFPDEIMAALDHDSLHWMLLSMGIGSEAVQPFFRVFERGSTRLFQIDAPYSFGPDLATRLVHALPKHTGLGAIALDENELGAVGMAMVASALAHVGPPRNVNLAKNDAGDGGAVAFCSAMEGSDKIKELNMSANAIGDVGARSLVTHAIQHPKLQELDLRENPISVPGGVALLRWSRAARNNLTVRMPDIIEAANQLTTPDCSDLTLTKPTAVTIHSGEAAGLQIALALSRGPALSLVELSMQKFGDRGAVYLSSALQRLPGLKVLRLHSNEIGESGGLALGLALPKLVSLRELVLGSNSIGKMGGLSISFGLSFSTTIEHVDVSKNPLGHHAVGLLVWTLTRRATIRVVLLESTNIAGPIDAFEDWIRGDPFVAVASTPIHLLHDDSVVCPLESLSLGNNRFDTLGGSLATVVGNFDELRHLHLDDAGVGDDALSDVIPVLTMLQHLQVFSIRCKSSDESEEFVMISDRGARLLAELLRSSSSLIELHLSGHRITENGMAELGAAVRKSTSLCLLDVTSRSLSADRLTAFLRELGSEAALRALRAGDVYVEIMGVEYLNTRNLDWNHLGISTYDVKWPPMAERFNWTFSRSDRDALYKFLESATASQSPLIRSRLFFVGRGGAGKTTLKYALLLSGHQSSATLSDLRVTILERIRHKWQEADIQGWVDNDLAMQPGFFREECPLAAGITGARWLEYTHDELIRVFGAANTERAHSVVGKMVRVLCFLRPDKAGKIPATISESDSPSGWEWIVEVVTQALERSGAEFAQGIVPDKSPETQGPSAVSSANKVPSPSSSPPRYAALLDMPHVMTEGVELERWDEAGFTLWDMPGQMEFYPIRRLFGAMTAIYVLLIDASHGTDDSLVQLRQWLSHLRQVVLCPSDDAPIRVCIVTSHTDDMDDTERSGLHRELLSAAKEHSRFWTAFTFGDQCYAPVYATPGGGTPETGVDALSEELRRLRESGPTAFAIPAVYQQICDDVVERSAALSRWPVIACDHLDYRGQEAKHVLPVLESLGFVQRFGSNSLVLEPVTWLSRIMGAFLHPYRGIYRGTVVNGSSQADHYNSVAVSSQTVRRVVNQQSQLIDARNEQDVLLLLSDFDVCIRMKDDDRFVFPMLLPPVAEIPKWLRPALNTAMARGVVARRYRFVAKSFLYRVREFATLLMRRLVLVEGLIPVFFGRGTLICSAEERNCFIGFMQCEIDRAIDLFAIGDDCSEHLALLTLHFTLLTKGTMSDQICNKHILHSMNEQGSAESTEHYMNPIEHPILGHCGIGGGRLAHQIFNLDDTTQSQDAKASPEDILHIMHILMLPDWLLAAFEPLDETIRLLSAGILGLGYAVEGESLREEVLVVSRRVLEAYSASCPFQPCPRELIHLLGKRAVDETVTATATFAKTVFLDAHARVRKKCGNITEHASPVPTQYVALKDGCQDPSHVQCRKCAARAECSPVDSYALEFKVLHLEPKKIQWANSNATLWATDDERGAVAMAKLYCPKLGPHEEAIKKDTFAALDATAIFNMVSWCKVFPEEFRGGEGAGQKAARARNSVCHASAGSDENNSAAIFEHLRMLLGCLEKHGNRETCTRVDEVRSALQTYEDQIESFRMASQENGDVIPTQD